jgi:hypothetical protein
LWLVNRLAFNPGNLGTNRKKEMKIKKKLVHALPVMKSFFCEF